MSVCVGVAGDGLEVVQWSRMGWNEVGSGGMMWDGLRESPSPPFLHFCLP